MSLFLDAAVIIIITVTCIVGYMRGFVRYVINMLGTLAAVVIALIASAALAEPVYDRYLYQPVTSAIETALDRIDVGSMVRTQLDEQGLGGYLTDDDIDRALEAGGNIADNISGMLSDKGADGKTAEEVRSKLSGFFDTELAEEIEEQYENSALSAYVKNMPSFEISSQQLSECVKMLCSDDKGQAADYLSENAVKPVLTPIIRVGLFIVCFILAELLIKLILLISGVFNKLPKLNAANRFGGLALGAAKGALYVALIAFMLCTVVNATHDSLSVLNSSVTDSTYLFRYFFDFFYK